MDVIIFILWLIVGITTLIQYKDEQVVSKFDYILVWICLMAGLICKISS